MISYAQTDIGRTRKMNQDYVFASSGPIGMLPNLLIVADGMGGHKAGDFASRYAVEQMIEMAESASIEDPVLFLRAAVKEVNSRLYAKSLENPELKGTGTTMVAAVITEDTVYAANVGDSRLYLLQKELKQVTHDHSLVEEMVALGKMERGSEEYKENKNFITRAVGFLPEVLVDLFEQPIGKGDCILMCSDGLTNMVEDEEIRRILMTTGTIKEKAEELVRRANENGGKDNISVILAEPQISEVKI